jgi:hypothetical protein
MSAFWVVKGIRLADRLRIRDPLGRLAAAGRRGIYDMCIRDVWPC